MKPRNKIIDQRSTVEVRDGYTIRRIPRDNKIRDVDKEVDSLKAMQKHKEEMLKFLAQKKGK